MTDYGGLMMPPPRSMHRRSRTGPQAAACRFPALRWALVSFGGQAGTAPPPKRLDGASGGVAVALGAEFRPEAIAMPAGRQTHPRPR